MKANQAVREGFVKDRKGYSFIVPMVIAIVIGFSLLAVGSYVVGVLGSAFEDSVADNKDTGFYNVIYHHNATTNTTTWRNVSLVCNVDDLDGARTKFYIYANGSAVQDDDKNINYNLTVNGVLVNKSDIIKEGEGWNTTLTTLLANANVTSVNTSLNFEFSVNSSYNQVAITIFGHYYVSSDWRSNNENKTVLLIGNITDGMSDVVDIEVVVIIITALSMAIIVIMAVGSRKKLF